MKVIFLDIDGVLNSEQFYIDRDHSPKAKKMWTKTSHIDAKAVDILNQITNKTDAKIVVSSAWRVGRTTEELQILLKSVGVTGEVIDRTKATSFDGIRGEEIQEWISRNKCDSFVILDDESDMGDLMHRLIKTDWKIGLLPEHVQQVIELFNK